MGGKLTLPGVIFPKTKQLRAVQTRACVLNKGACKLHQKLNQKICFGVKGLVLTKSSISLIFNLGAKKIGGAISPRCGLQL